MPACNSKQMIHEGGTRTRRKLKLPRTHCEPLGVVPLETVTRGIAVRVTFDAAGGGGGTGRIETEVYALRPPLLVGAAHDAYQLQSSLCAEKLTYLARGQAEFRMKMAHSLRSVIWLAAAWKLPLVAVALVQPAKLTVLAQTPVVGWAGSRLTPPATRALCVCSH